MNRLSLNVSKERLGVLIGRKGEVKKHIENSLDVLLEIDSISGTMVIESKSSDVMNIWKARDLILAISKGFSPDRAFKLLVNDELILEIVDLRDIFGKSESSIKRIKSRIIGREGKTRRILEEVSKVDISIYGHTVSIIGGYEDVLLARDAIKMLIDGRSHSTVYKFLSNKRREIKKRSKVELWK
jgi:ribosomal RNA assembly protein